MPERSLKLLRSVLLVAAGALVVGAPLPSPSAPGNREDGWALWLSPRGEDVRPDQVQRDFGTGSHAGASARRRVGQTFVPSVSPLVRIDLRLNNRRDTTPGWIRLYRWRGSRAASVAAEPLWRDRIDLSGPPGFRRHAFYPFTEVEPGQRYLIELGADERSATFDLRHMYTSRAERAKGVGLRDRYAQGKMFVDGKTPQPDWDLWFITYGPGGEPGTHARTLAPALEAREPGRWHEPLRAKPVDDDAYETRLRRRSDHQRRGFLAGCTPQPNAAAGHALLYQLSCTSGRRRCDEEQARTSFELLRNAAAWRFCRAGHPSRAPRCGTRCGKSGQVATPWLLTAALSYEWIRESPALGEGDRALVREVLVQFAEDVWERREFDHNNRTLMNAASYAWIAGLVPEHPEAPRWIAHARAVWEMVWKQRDTAEDSASYGANVWWPSFVLLARALGHEETFWADAKIRSRLRREFDHTTPLGVAPAFGHGVGWFHEPTARIWFFELAAAKLAEPEYKWLARRSFDYLRRYVRDRPPVDDALGSSIWFLGLAALDSDPSLLLRPPSDERALRFASDGGDQAALRFDGGEVASRSLVQRDPSGALAGIDVSWDPLGSDAALELRIWRSAERPLRRPPGPPEYAATRSPNGGGRGWQRARFTPLLSPERTQDAGERAHYWLEVQRDASAFALRGVAIDGAGSQPFALEATQLVAANGSRVTARSEALRLPPPPNEKQRVPFAFTGAERPDKLVLRSGNGEDDLYALFNLGRDYGHGQEELGALLAVVDGGSLLFQDGPFPYWFHQGGVLQDESVPFLRRHAGGSLGAEPGKHAEVTRFVDGRHATLVSLEWPDPRGWGVRQERRIVFAKNRFLLVRDAYHFPERMLASYGPLWQISEVRPARTAGHAARAWFDIYHRVPLGNVWKMRNPERYALLHLLPRPGATVEAWREESRLPPEDCREVDRANSVKAECRAGPSRIIAQRRSGWVEAGASQWFETLIVPHGDESSPDALARAVRVLDASDDHALELQLGDERWLVADLERAGRLRSSSSSAAAASEPAAQDATWEVEAKSALVCVSSDRPPYVLAEGAKRIAYRGARTASSWSLEWPAASDLERGSVGEERPIP